MALLLAASIAVISMRADGTNTVTETNTFTVHKAIPSNNPNGVADTEIISFTNTGIAQITSVQVGLNLPGDYNGDIYCYLTHASQSTNAIAILLNRVGRTSLSGGGVAQYGYLDHGFNVTLSDAATNDIHTYEVETTPPLGFPITGTWQPDARFINPNQAVSSSPRTAFLSGFKGLQADGSWVLFVADVSTDSVYSFSGWTLYITGIPKATPTIAWASPAAVTYGAPLSALQLNATATVGGTNVAGTFYYSPTNGTILNAGSQTLTVSFIPSDTNNIAVATATVPLVVQQQLLVVTATNQTRSYGAANPSFGGPPLVGLTNNDKIAAAFTNAATVASPVNQYPNQYPIIPVLIDPTGRLGNYNVQTNYGYLTITPAVLTITALPRSRPYGAPNPSNLGWVATGFFNGDTVTSALTGSPSLTTTATPTSPVGDDYPISVGLGTLSATNYSFIFFNSDLTISQAPLIGTVASESRDYGATNPVFTLTYSGFVAGDGTGVLSGPLNLQCLATTNSPVGTYTISASGQSNANYALSYVPGVLTVEPALLWVQGTSTNRAYGQPNPPFTATISGFVNGEDTNVLGGWLEVNCAAVTNSPVGQYPIVPSGLTSTNYNITNSNGLLSITAYALAVNEQSYTRLYGSPNPQQLNGTLIGLQDGDSITATYITTATVSSAVGVYPIVPVFTDPYQRLTNYSVTTNAGTLTILAAPLTVFITNQTRYYGGTNSQPVGQLAGLVNGDPITANYTTLVTPATPVGTYSIVPVFQDPNGLLGNYNVSTNGGVFNIVEAPVGVTADPQSRPYGTANPPLTWRVSGLVNGDTEASAFMGNPNLSTLAVAASPVGSYPIVLSLGSLSTSNYNITNASGNNLTVTRAPLSVVLANASRFYGQTNPTFTASYEGFVNGDGPQVLQGTFKSGTTALTNSPVGNYPIYGWNLGAANYVIGYEEGTLAIEQAPLLVQANDASRGYGQTNPPFTASISGFVNGDTTNVLQGSLTNYTDAGIDSPVGTYAIEPSGLSATNYTMIYSNGILTINAFSLQVNVVSASRYYGATNPTLTATFVGLQPGDNIQANCTSPATTNSPVGSYPIFVGLLDPNSKLANYGVITNNGSLTVQAAPLTAAVLNQSRGYGAANPPLASAYVITGLQNGDNITASCWTTADTNSPVGRYDISIELVDPSNLETNYTVTLDPGILTVTQAVLTVSSTNFNRPYGSPNPTNITGSISGLQNGDVITATFASAATNGSPVGSYVITPTFSDPGKKLGNYVVVNQDGVLNVTAAALQGIVQNTNRLYGATNPAFTVNYAGFVNGDNIGVVSGLLNWSCAATNNSPVGPYPIQASGQSAANYNIQYVNGTLLVEPEPLVVQAGDTNRVYGATNPVFTASYSGFVNGDTPAVLGGALYLYCSATNNSPVGQYPIVPSGLTSTNYNITNSKGLLTVTPYALSVAAGSFSRAYGATNPVLSGTLTGVQNGDNIQVNYVTLAATNSPVGAYAIAPNVFSIPAQLLSNYTVMPTNGLLTITQATLVVSANNQSRAFGVPNATPAGTILGLTNGDNITAAFATTATASSPPGTYPITISLSDPGSALPNYLLTTNNGTLTITQAMVAGTVVSSANPVLVNSNVIFSITLVPPGSGEVGGSVQFTEDGVAFGPAVAVVWGLAVFGTSALPLGTHSIVAQYSGDSNFLAGSFALASPQVVVTVPVAGNYKIQRAPGQGTRVQLSDLVAASSDADGATLSFNSADTRSAQGGSISYFPGGWLFYEPPAGLTTQDTFGYSVRDIYGTTGAGVVTITVATQTAPRLALAVDWTNDLGHLVASGIPWMTYSVQYEPRLKGTNWQTLATGTADSQGHFAYDDALPPGNQPRFYRAVYAVPGAPGSVVMSVASSANPSLPGELVTLTATVAADDPGLGFPSGTVQFLDNGTNLGAPAVLVEGVATNSTSLLPAGSNVIQVVYGGGGAFLAASATLEPAQIVNDPPIVGTNVVYAPVGGTKVKASDLLTNDVSPLGNPLTMVSVSPTSVEGAALSLLGGWVYYTPPTGFAGVDAFNYTFQDSFGASAVATVEVQPLVSSTAAQHATVLPQPGGGATIIFLGIPTETYIIQYAADANNPVWTSLSTNTADSWGNVQYQATAAQLGTFQAIPEWVGPTASAFREAVWTNFIANTNGRTMQIWSQRVEPEGWPDVAPQLAWNTNCLLYGLDGFTAISQCNEFEGEPGQVPITLLTRRHGYTRGHGMGPSGFSTTLAGKRVWFCTASNTVVQMTVAADVIQVGTIADVAYDYGLVVFTEDVPDSITPMSVMTAADYETYYTDTPDLPFMYLGTEQQGYCSAQVPPFVFDLLEAGDSGSPNMIPTPLYNPQGYLDNKLVMFSGRTTSGASPQMQADMDALTTYVGLGTNNYQLRWYNMQPWGPSTAIREPAGKPLNPRPAARASR